jgi:metallo-beta-lactamase class B
MRNRRILLAILIASAAATLQAQNQIDWNAPFPPHTVVGNVHYVGTAQLASFLVTTPEGHILVNSSFESTVPVIRASVEKLGFRFTDIRILVGSHAHGDHMEGDALVKELTQAQVMAMEEDVPGLRAMRPGGKAHPIDRVLRDGDEVKLGGTTLVARRTGGHTRGCTTWTLQAQEAGRSYNVAILCSVGVNPGYVLVGNKDYPEIADDYARSFKLLRSLPVDVFLGAHGSFYGLPGKHARLSAGGAASGGANPFVDPDGFKAHLDLQEKNFLARLAEQRKVR